MSGKKLKFKNNKYSLTALLLLASISTCLGANERIQAENYSHFIDTTSGNQGGALHNDDVDIEVTTDNDGGFNVGWITQGERLDYQLDLLSGNYNLTSRVASAVSSGSYSAYLDGELIGTDTVTNTGGWQIFDTHLIGNINVNTGSHTLAIEVLSGDFNLNWFELSAVNSDLVIQAEDYQRAFDSTVGNTGGEYRFEDDVDIEISSDIDGGYNIGWTDSGEWLEYDISVADGNYNLISRVASELDTGHYSILIDDVLVSTHSVNNTDDWQVFESQNLGEVNLASGSHTLRINIEQGDFNLNWLQLQYITPPADSDNDGIIDEIDICPNTPAETKVDETGCELMIFPAYENIEAESYTLMSGISIKNNAYIGSFDSGDYISFKNVDFGDISQSLTLNVAGESENGIAEFRIDSSDGPLIASYTMTATSGWQVFEQTSLNITETSGIHDLYISAKTGQGIFNLDSFIFSAKKLDSASDIKVMTLNVYGWATMPQQASSYAELVHSRDVDILGIQEGAEDWLISTDFPTDYSRADALGLALGECWQQRYQIYINTCKGNSFVSNVRFDLTDGPNAVRTGESALISKNGFDYRAINVHWDHQDDAVTLINANETATHINLNVNMPTILVGDFNSSCTGIEVNTTIQQTNMTLIGSARIDCIITKGFTGTAEVFDATPSDRHCHIQIEGHHP